MLNSSGNYSCVVCVLRCVLTLIVLVTIVLITKNEKV
jgi:hypothetical protein